MKKAKKSLISIILNGFANIFSFKDYSRRTRRIKSNYFKRNESQFMKLKDFIYNKKTKESNLLGVLFEVVVTIVCGAVIYYGFWI